MEKLSILMPEQEALIPIIRDKWINQLFDLKEINISQLTEGINWLYSFCKMETPKIIICESLLESQIVINLLKNGANVGANVEDNVGDNVRANVWANVRANVGANVGDNVRANVEDNVGANVWANVRANVRANVEDNVGANVWANVRANVGANVEDNVGANVWANVRANVGANVWDNVEDNVWDNVGDNVRANVGANVEDNGFQYEPICTYGDINDYEWVSFYNFFTEIGFLNNSNFNSFVSLLQSNYFTMIQMEKVCAVVKNPKHILLNEQKQMNSTKDYAIKFNDNTGMYFVNGFYLSDELFFNLSTKKYSFDDFTKETNEEIKSAVIAFYQQEFGDEFLFNFFSKNLKEVNTFVDKKDKIFLEGTTNGMNVGVYTLFKGFVNNIDVAYIRCYCPSTDRMFFLGVDSNNTNAKDAIASLYRIPKLLVNEIKTISRQGEKFSTTFTEKGNTILKTLSEKQISDLVSVAGDIYFNKMTYEY